MSQSLQKASSSAALPPRPTAVPRRLSAWRLRGLFLRHYRNCGEVRQAAARAGVARSMLYRWREKDERFRARWDTYDEVKRQEAEARLLQLVREGEKVSVFYKGEHVGWRTSFTARPAAALMAAQDRREKMLLMAGARAEKRRCVSHSSDLFQAENANVSEAWGESDPRKTHVAEEPETSQENEGPAEEIPPPPPTPTHVASAEEEREAQEWGECVYRAQLAQQEAAAAGRSPADAHEFVPRTPSPTPSPPPSDPGGPYRLVESTRGPHMLPDDSRRFG